MGTQPLVTIDVVNGNPEYAPPLGVITGNGIDCPGDCTVDVAVDSPVSLTAKSCGDDICSLAFSGWSEPCAGNPDFPLRCEFKASRQPAGGKIEVRYHYVILN